MDPLPGETGHRFALVTDENHSGYLWIASILCLVYSALVLIVRLHIKWNLYGFDDLLVLIATFMQLGEVVPLFVGMKSGLGQRDDLLDEAQLDKAGTSTFTSQIFLIIALCLAKCSIVCLMLRLFTRDMKVTRRSWWLCNITLALTIAWGIGAVVGTSTACTPSSLLKESAADQCAEPLTRWRIITAVDVVTELLLVLLPIILVWPIQMKKYIKFQVVLAFAFRIPVIGFSLAHLHFVSRYDSRRPVNTSQTIIPALVYLQFQLFWSLLSSTIPSLKAFMKSFNSGFGMEIDLDGYGYGSRQYGSNSYRLETMESAKEVAGNSKVGMKVHRKHHDDGGKGEAVKRIVSQKKEFRPETVGTETSIYHPERRREDGSSVTSDGSQDMIIRRDVQWTIHHEDVKVI
ncbi:hypothetical protein M501DRAFT_1006112 [Patellaria atrata CBS 101060]|uniref:Rhodopsin domain-containing protein n=1 Tax=Patellaria atrata CBS 101060 TaxID=1346257 RepID=A0A9P4VS39_9PEZI|nr:hypothetical protein M501DRAFT_1006112 [Patellaria atrata CBS 101060]